MSSRVFQDHLCPQHFRFNFKLVKLILRHSIYFCLRARSGWNQYRFTWCNDWFFVNTFRNWEYYVLAVRAFLNRLLTLNIHVGLTNSLRESRCPPVRRDRTDAWNEKPSITSAVETLQSQTCWNQERTGEKTVSFICYFFFRSSHRDAQLIAETGSSVNDGCERAMFSLFSHTSWRRDASYNPSTVRVHNERNDRFDYARRYRFDETTSRRPFRATGKAGPPSTIL